LDIKGLGESPRPFSFAGLLDALRAADRHRSPSTDRASPASRPRTPRAVENRFSAALGVAQPA